MTDTNQASELYELCKEVYEKTGWEAPETYKAEDGNPENDWQAYDTDYLLEKLPDTIGLYREERTPDKWLAACEDGISYGGKHVECGDDECGCESYYGESDTPLKALLKLCLVLKEAGELK